MLRFDGRIIICVWVFTEEEEEEEEEEASLRVGYEPINHVALWSRQVRQRHVLRWWITLLTWTTMSGGEMTVMASSTRPSSSSSSSDGTAMDWRSRIASSRASFAEIEPRRSWTLDRLRHKLHARTANDGRHVMGSPGSHKTRKPLLDGTTNSTNKRQIVYVHVCYCPWRFRMYTSSCNVDLLQKTTKKYFHDVVLNFDYNDLHLRIWLRKGKDEPARQIYRSFHRHIDTQYPTECSTRTNKAIGNKTTILVSAGRVMELMAGTGQTDGWADWWDAICKGP